MMAVFLVCLFILLAYSAIPSLSMRLFLYLSKKICRHKPVIYLTFDDGPSSIYTRPILDLLEQYNIKATFFVVGEFVLENKELLSHMKASGHLVGIHSLEHKCAIFRGNSFVKNDLLKSLDILNDIGIKAKYYRPPWGLFNIFSVYWTKKLGLKLVLWDVMAEDWEARATSQSIHKKLLTRTFNGSIICLHDGRGAENSGLKTLEALKKTIPLLIDMGYTFKRIDEYE